MDAYYWGKGHSKAVSVRVRAKGAREPSGVIRHMGDSMYPHECIQCGAAAYIGGDNLCRCTNEECLHADPELSMAKLADEFGEEDTEPQLFHVDFNGMKIKWPV